MNHLNHYDDCPQLRQVDELIKNYYQKGDYEICFQGCLELAEQGYALAECQVGYFYFMGQGTPADLDKALYWTRRAAEHGDPDAPGNLAEMEQIQKEGVSYGLPGETAQRGAVPVHGRGHFSRAVPVPGQTVQV